MAVEANRRRLTVGRAGPGESGPGAARGSALCKNLPEKKIGGMEDFFKKNNVTCIHSVTDGDMKKKRSYADKDKMASCTDGKEVSVFTQGDANFPKIPGVEYTCKKGLKPESPNQDSYVVVVCPGKWGLYGVFDGHGPNGHDVSDFSVKTLVDLFFEKEDFISKTQEAFTYAFTQCQKAIEAAKGTSGLDSSSSGSTCTMAFHDISGETLTIAHVGDSRGVLFQGDKAPYNIMKETEDHKPNLPAEKARIEKSGGRVVFDGYYNYRVFAKAGMYPGLNMSRALGDVVAHKEAGLTAEPECAQISLKDRSSGLTLIIASDGVWEFIESKQAPDHLKIGSATSMTVGDKEVESLAKKSWDSWMEDSDNEISDDITVIAVKL